MRLAVAIRDARRTWRVQRAQAAVVSRYHAARAANAADNADAAKPAWHDGVRRWGARLLTAALLPLLVPLFTWLGLVQHVLLFHAVAAFATMFGGGIFLQHSLLCFASDDVLRQPSKAGVLLTRLVRASPKLLFVGMCWAVGLALLLWDGLTTNTGGRVVLCIAVLVAPPLGTLGRLHARLTIGMESTLGPLAAGSLFWGIVWFVFVDDVREWPDIVFAVLCGILGTFAAVRVLWSWITQPRIQLRALGTDLAILPRWAVAIGLLALAPVADSGVDRAFLLGPVAWITLGFVVIWSVVTLARVVTAVRDAEESTVGMIVQEADISSARSTATGQTLLPTRHGRRRSPMRAALYLHRRKSWFRLQELASVGAVLRALPAIFFGALHHSWGVLLSVLAVAMTTDTTVHTTLAFLAGFMAPAFVVNKPNPRLHLLGVDYRVQAWQNLRAVLYFAVVPVLLAAVVTGTLAGWNTPRFVVVGCVVVSFALRLGWRGLFGTGELEPTNGGPIFALLALLAGSVFLPTPSYPWSLACLGLAAGVGVIGIVRRVRGFRESRLVAEVRTIMHDDG